MTSAADQFAHRVGIEPGTHIDDLLNEGSEVEPFEPVELEPSGDEPETEPAGDGEPPADEPPAPPETDDSDDSGDEPVQKDSLDDYQV